MSGAVGAAVKLIGAFASGVIVYKVIHDLLYHRKGDQDQHKFSTGSFSSLLAQIEFSAEYGNAQQVIEAMDRWFSLPYNNLLGMTKIIGVLNEQVKNLRPKVVIEFGGFGYSSVHVAHSLPEGARLFLIESDPLRVAVATRLLTFAGLASKCQVICYKDSSAEQVIEKIRSYGVDSVDLVLMNHFKNLYLPDLKLLESKAMLNRGAVVVADGILVPGAPSFKKYVTSSPDKFQTTILPFRGGGLSRNADEVSVTVIL
eukprot:TRINITY_DN3942_c0_g2_i1.p1 TRINITY_DN3942_c0_g2~~TRINITY_DN3942_c0_g2_i1.p1  ORF type:complete len:257 (-),score=66.04 TRINITY_DN3942_c0_g2_i1:89-859(-)